MSTPYERLMAEELPTGTFGDAAHAPKPPAPNARPWTAQEQLDHRRTLDDALDGWHDTTDPRYLRAVPNLPTTPTQPAQDTTAA